MEEKLGLHAPPRRRFLFVGQDEQDSNACWYELDQETKKKHYVQERSLWGYLSGIRLRNVTTSKGDKMKFELLVDAGESFTIRAGANTNFSRGVILSLTAIANPEELRKRLVIEVSPSTQNAKIVFGAVYFADTGQRIKYDWDKDIELDHLVQHLQTIVGDGGLQEDAASDDDEENAAPPFQQPRTERHSPGQGKSEPSASSGGVRMINAGQKSEIIRCATLAGLAFEPGTPNESLADLKALMDRTYGVKNLDDLTFDQAIELRKTLLAM